MSVTRCTCDAPHVEKVRTSAISIFGEGEAWRAAKPGGIYIAGHGFHFDTEEDAMAYAFPPAPTTTPPTASTTKEGPSRAMAERGRRGSESPDRSHGPGNGGR